MIAQTKKRAVRARKASTKSNTGASKVADILKNKEKLAKNKLRDLAKKAGVVKKEMKSKLKTLQKEFASKLAKAKSEAYHSGFAAAIKEASKRATAKAAAIAKISAKFESALEKKLPKKLKTTKRSAKKVVKAPKMTTVKAAKTMEAKPAGARRRGRPPKNK
jgi:hypothetical protein